MCKKKIPKVILAFDFLVFLCCLLLDWFLIFITSFLLFILSFTYSLFFKLLLVETKFIYLRLFFPKVGIYCHKLTSKFTYYLTLISIYDTFWYVVCSVQNTFHFLFGFSFWPMDYLELLLSFKCLGIFQLSFYYWFQTIILWSENKICLTWIFCSLLHVWPTRWS